MTTAKRYRVIQWATGNIGTRALQMVMDHPRMDLVGLYVSNPEKVGVDAGTLAGREPVGIVATNSVDAIVALDADCVLYMRQGYDYDEVCRLLESGKNIVATRSEFHHPAGMPAALRDRLEAACLKGGSSLYSTGSSPGFITEALPLPLLSLQRRLDCLTIDEYGDVSKRNSPDMLFNRMCFGKKPEDFNPGRLAHLKESFGASLRQIADAIGSPLDSVEGFVDLALTRKRETIAAGVVEPGTIGCQRITLEGLHRGRAIIRFRANWFLTLDLDQDWSLQDSGWRVQVAGDTPLDVSIRYPVAKEDFPLFTPGLTAHRAVNAVPMVCEAAPGLRTTVDLPQVIPIF